MRLSRGRGGSPDANEPMEAGDVEFVDAPPGDLLVEEVPTSDTVTVLAAVNLLPKTYAQRAAVKRAKIFAAIAVVIALLLALLGWLIATQKQSAAQESLDAATAERTLLTAEAAQYSEVPKVFSAVADAQAQLRLAMGNEVRWSFFLNDLGTHHAQRGLAGHARRYVARPWCTRTGDRPIVCGCLDSHGPDVRCRSSRPGHDERVGQGLHLQLGGQLAGLPGQAPHHRRSVRGQPHSRHRGGDQDRHLQLHGQRDC